MIQIGAGVTSTSLAVRHDKIHTSDSRLVHLDAANVELRGVPEVLDEVADQVRIRPFGISAQSNSIAWLSDRTGQLQPTRPASDGFALGQAVAVGQDQFRE